MEVIYVSQMTSKRIMTKIINESKINPLQSIQKYHRLLCNGMVKNNIKVKAISVIPMSKKISDKIFWIEKKEIEEKVEYNYVPFINVKILRQICIFIFASLNIIKQANIKGKDKIFICDILNTTISYTTLILSKIFRFRCIAIVTDLPKDIGKKRSISKIVHRILQNKFDGYIVLTEDMNDVINTRGKQHVVIEGIADISMKNVENNILNKYDKKVCIYAGGLYEKYGVKALIEAFIKQKSVNSELHLYGFGELEEYIENIEDERIKFYGVVTNDKIVQEELKATLLINPRFTNEEYTKYSFPSKNMEYMASGTPVLTTKLPGMPKEYYEYIYTFEEESIEAYAKKLETILELDKLQLYEKGKKAKEFVMTKKNNIEQSKKILTFFK